MFLQEMKWSEVDALDREKVIAIVGRSHQRTGEEGHESANVRKHETERRLRDGRRTKTRFACLFRDFELSCFRDPSPFCLCSVGFQSRLCQA